MFAESLIGRQLGGYLITDLVGRGGMGIVFRARHEDGGVVAIKVMAPELARDDELRERFIREASVAIDHPNVLPIYSAGLEDEHLFITMKLIEGRDLKAEIQTGGRLRPSRIVTIFDQAGAALDAAHESGVVHRDVKPQNFLLEKGTGSTEHLYLSDFGLVKNVAGSSLTASAHLMGTAHYMSPEQIRNRRIDGRSDVYSLGCVLYECITGKVPFGAREEVAVLFSHVNDEPPHVTAEVPTMPRALDTVIGKALAKEPADRYLTAGDLVADVSEILLGDSSPRRLWGPLAIRTQAPAAPDRSEQHQTTARRGVPAYVGWIAAALVALVAVVAPSRAPDPAADRLSLAGTDEVLADDASGRPTTGASNAERERLRDRSAGDAGSAKQGDGKLLPLDPREPVQVADGAVKKVATPVPGPAYGRYVYEQKGHEALCPVDAGCSEGSNVWARQELIVSPTSSTEPNRYVTASRHSSRFLMQTHVLQSRGSTRLVETLMTFNTTEGGFSVRLRPDPAADLLRFPLEAEDRWTGAWTSRPVSGSYDVEVAGSETTTVAGRRIEMVRVRTTITWDGPHAGRLETTSWIDPRTRLALETVGTIEANTGEGDQFYKITYQSTLTSGPGYRR